MMIPKPRTFEKKGWQRKMAYATRGSYLRYSWIPPRYAKKRYSIRLYRPGEADVVDYDASVEFELWVWVRECMTQKTWVDVPKIKCMVLPHLKFWLWSYKGEIGWNRDGEFVAYAQQQKG
jgi:hypothetical protein